MDKGNASYMMEKDSKGYTEPNIQERHFALGTTRIIPVLHWYNYHSWARALKHNFSQAGLLKYVLSPERTYTNPNYRRLASEVSAILLRSTISPSILSLLSPHQLLDGPSLWAALEAEFVPKGLVPFVLCSVAVQEGPFDDESEEQWEFRKRKLEEEVRYCGVERTEHLDFLVRMMRELGQEFEGLKGVWLEMKVEELTRDVVEWMIEGWVLNLCGNDEQKV